MTSTTSHTLRIAAFILPPPPPPLALLPYFRNLPCSPPCALVGVSKNKRSALSVFKGPPPILSFARAELILIALQVLLCLLFFRLRGPAVLGLRTPQNSLLLSPDPQPRHSKPDRTVKAGFGSRSHGQNLIPTPHHGGMSATDHDQ